VLFLTIGFTLAFLPHVVRIWRALSHKIPSDFDPTAVQMVAMGWLLKTHGSPQSLGNLHEQLRPLTANAGGRAFLERQMEGLEHANVVEVTRYQGSVFYSLTQQGRDLVLDQIERAARERPATDSP